MPRRTPVRELQKEEVVGSPLRRSSRLSSSSPVPTKVITRRNSSSEVTSSSTPKVTRTRRSSVNQDSESIQDEKTKPTSTIRTRRSSLVKTNDQAEEEPVPKPKTRGSSVPKEQSLPVKTASRRRTSISKDENESESKEQTVEVKTTRRRRSVTEDAPPVDEESTRKSTRLRSLSTKKSDDSKLPSTEVTSQLKAAPGSTPLKHSPSLEFSESLESIKENNQEINSPDESPSKKFKRKNTEITKIDFDLSIINEASLTEEETSPKKNTTTTDDKNVSVDNSAKNDMEKSYTTSPQKDTSLKLELDNTESINNVEAEANESNTSFTLNLSSPEDEDIDKNGHGVNNKENVSPKKQNLIRESECEPMEVDDVVVELSSPMKMKLMNSPKVFLGPRVDEIEQELQVAEKITDEMAKFLSEEVKTKSPAKTKVVSQVVVVLSKTDKVTNPPTKLTPKKLGAEPLTNGRSFEENENLKDVTPTKLTPKKLGAEPLTNGRSFEENENLKDVAKITPKTVRHSPRIKGDDDKTNAEVQMQLDEKASKQIEKNSTDQAVTKEMQKEGNFESKKEAHKDQPSNKLDSPKEDSEKESLSSSFSTELLQKETIAEKTESSQKVTDNDETTAEFIATTEDLVSTEIRNNKEKEEEQDLERENPIDESIIIVDELSSDTMPATEISKTVAIDEEESTTPGDSGEENINAPVSEIDSITQGKPVSETKGQIASEATIANESNMNPLGQDKLAEEDEIVIISDETTNETEKTDNSDESSSLVSTTVTLFSRDTKEDPSALENEIIVHHKEAKETNLGNESSEELEVEFADESNDVESDNTSVQQIEKTETNDSSEDEDNYRSPMKKSQPNWICKSDDEIFGTNKKRENLKSSNIFERSIDAKYTHTPELDEKKQKSAVVDEQESLDRSVEKQSISKPAIEVMQEMETSVNENNLEQESSILTNGVKKRSSDRTSITLQETMKLGETPEQGLSGRIHKYVDLFCAGIKNKSDVSINVSLEYVGQTSDAEDESKTNMLEISLTASDVIEKGAEHQKGSKRRKIYYSSDNEMESSFVESNMADDTQSADEDIDVSLNVSASADEKQVSSAKKSKKRRSSGHGTQSKENSFVRSSPKVSFSITSEDGKESKKENKRTSTGNVSTKDSPKKKNFAAIPLTPFKPANDKTKIEETKCATEEESEVEDSNNENITSESEDSYTNLLKSSFQETDPNDTTWKESEEILSDSESDDLTEEEEEEEYENTNRRESPSIAQSKEDNSDDSNDDVFLKSDEKEASPKVAKKRKLFRSSTYKVALDSSEKEDSVEKDESSEVEKQSKNEDQDFENSNEDMIMKPEEKDVSFKENKKRKLVPVPRCEFDDSKENLQNKSKSKSQKQKKTKPKYNFSETKTTEEMLPEASEVRSYPDGNRGEKRGLHSSVVTDDENWVKENAQDAVNKKKKTKELKSQYKKEGDFNKIKPSRGDTKNTKPLRIKPSTRISSGWIVTDIPKKEVNIQF